MTADLEPSAGRPRDRLRVAGAREMANLPYSAPLGAQGCLEPTSSRSPQPKSAPMVGYSPAKLSVFTINHSVDRNERGRLLNREFRVTRPQAFGVASVSGLAAA